MSVSEPALEKSGSRRRKRNPEISRERILAAATEEFAAMGFGDARVDEIARRAGINKRMLYHYFGNKDDLFQAVLELIYETICKAGQSLDLDSVGPRQGLTRLVDFVWNYYLDNPQSITLLNTENLHNARHLRSSQKTRTVHPPFESMISKLLESGAAAGDFRPGISALALYITIVGMIYYYLSNNATLSVFFDRDLRTPDELKHWHRHVHETIERLVLVAP